MNAAATALEILLLQVKQAVAATDVEQTFTALHVFWEVNNSKAWPAGEVEVVKVYALCFLKFDDVTRWWWWCTRFSVWFYM